MTGRSVPEWRGKTPDSKVPDHVRLRIFLRDEGRCHISGRKITSGEPWDLEHKIALCNGGEHRESNLAPALRDKHRAKTAADLAERAMIDRKRKADLGIRRAPQIKSRGFDPRPPQHKATRPLSKALPPRRIGGEP
jgi:5-methylcytosine-specific restriction endonuclease McrA